MPFDVATLASLPTPPDPRPTMVVRNFSVLAYAQGNTHYGYHTTHRMADVARGAYWRGWGTSGSLVDGDTVVAACADGQIHLAVFCDGCSDNAVSIGVLGAASRVGAA